MNEEDYQKQSPCPINIRKLGTATLGTTEPVETE